MFQDTLPKICIQLLIKSFPFNFPDEWKAGLARNLKFAFEARRYHRNPAPINYNVANFVGITEVDFIMSAVFIQVALSSDCILH